MKPAKSRNYQSVMIMTLNKNDGKATKKEIQQELHKANPDLPPEHFNEFPFDVLEKNGVVTYDKQEDLYILPAFGTYKDRSGKKGNISFYCREKIFDREITFWGKSDFFIISLSLTCLQYLLGKDYYYY